MRDTKRDRKQQRKERLFALAALLVPVAVLVCGELVLRLVGYGSDERLFVPFELAPGYLRSNDAVAKRYFVSEATLPTIPLEIFRESKTDGSVRVVVQGGSSAAGFPYYFGAGLADQLELILGDLLPDRSVEVIGTAMAAVNTYTLLDLSDEILELQPDVVVIYAGHNEFYGALGVGSSESLGDSPTLKRLYLTLRRFRTVQALRDVLAGLAGFGASTRPGRPPGVTLMERMVREQSIPYQSADYRAGVDQFASNLKRLLDKYAAHNVPVILGTLTSNVRDQPPFIDGAAADTDVASLKRQVGLAEKRLASKDTTEATTMLQQIVDRDTVFAAARYRLGKVLLATGNRSEGRNLLYQAKDRDQLRFRAPEALNQIIRSSAGAHTGVFIADVQTAFDDLTADGVADSTLMTEHLHPNLKGYRVLARAFVDAMKRAGLLGLSESVAPVPVASVTRLDSLLGEIRLRRLKGSWPFKPAGSIASDLLDAEPNDVEEAAAMQVFKEERGRTEVLEELRKYYVEQRRFRDARDAALAIALRFPFMAKPLIDAGDAAMSMEQPDAALAYYRASLEREESAAAHRMVGAILLQRGDRQKAISHLRRAVELNPNHPQALYNLAGALALTGDFDGARQICRTLLEKYPDHEAGRKLLASLP